MLAFHIRTSGQVNKKYNNEPLYNDQCLNNVQAKLTLIVRLSENFACFVYVARFRLRLVTTSTVVLNAVLA